MINCEFTPFKRTAFLLCRKEYPLVLFSSCDTFVAVAYEMYISLKSQQVELINTVKLFNSVAWLLRHYPNIAIYSNLYIVTVLICN